MSFQGSIQELPVPDIIQLVSVSGKTGMFMLVRGAERGYIYLRNGRIVHAELGGVTGEEAVYALATGDEHAIKFTEACLREHALNPKPVYLAAARAAVGSFG